MKLDDLKSKLKSSHEFIFVMAGEDAQVSVSPDLIYRQVGNPPRRITYTTQNEYHDAYYQWSDQAKEFSKSKLETLAREFSLESTMTFNAWDRPVLTLKKF